MMRPKVEAALVIASKYEANVGFMPLVTAYVGMKNKGVNMPRNMKNNELIRRRYLVFLNASAMKKDVVLGGRRGLTVKHENPISGTMTNPMIRTDQPNPIDESFNILDKAIGNTTPPIEEPETTIPNAAARFLSKKHTLTPKRSNIGPPMAPAANWMKVDMDPIQATLSADSPRSWHEKKMHAPPAATSQARKPPSGISPE
ncbi:hypothetical protein CEP51_008045 [Fusarium floridanum]|uniref:Uncharacterized protein n=1 Tax=Fusarium floridanum TaxID=1325733 RepID=A0A428RM83_9HYPO|nr:hypothetical protein CEP51_008045 [Fusarium floridanum]